MTTRPYHHGNLRAALLDAAVETVRARGVQELSLRELARDVGVSHAAPRRHFPDKQALLDALAEAGFERLGSEMQRAMEAAGPGFEARLGAFADAYVRFAVRDGALLELMFASKRRSDAADGLRAAADRAFAAPLALIAEGQAAGAFMSGDVERVGTLALASLQGLAALVNGGMIDADQLDDLVPGAVDQIVRGLRPHQTVSNSSS